MLKLDNTPIGMEERMEIQQMTMSDQDIVNGNNEISVNANKSVSSKNDRFEYLLLSVGNVLMLAAILPIWILNFKLILILGETKILE